MLNESFIRKIYVRLPWSLLIPLLLISFLGIINLSSAAQSTRPDLYLSHMTKLFLSFFICMFTAIINPRIIRQFSYFGFFGVVFLLLAVLIVGVSAKGGQRWLVLGPFRIQPSDPAKLFLILALADYCSRYWPLKGFSINTLIKPFNLSRPAGFLLLLVGLLYKERHEPKIFFSDFLVSKVGFFIMLFSLLIGFSWLFLSIYFFKKNGPSLDVFLAPIDLPLILFILVAAEPDLGTALILLAIAGLMLLFVGIRRSAIFFGLLGAAVIAFFAYFTLLHDYQKDRLITFLNKENDIHGKGYQAVQSMIAIGSGKILGKGFSEGTQTQLSFLPENATDFVFSVWAEEWGFICSIFLLILYLFLLRGILNLVLKVEDQFSKLICIGTASSIFLHVFINVGMVTGILPVVGVPLVLFSYGGSAMITTMVQIGLVINVAIYKGAK